MTSRLDVPSFGVSHLRWSHDLHILGHMITPERNMARVTMTLDPIDVDLLDRLAVLEGSNRSAELRSILVHLRPMVQATVAAFEAAMRTRTELGLAAAQASALELQELVPEVERLQAFMVGSMARLEGAAAARDPLPSNHGGHTHLTRGNENEPEPEIDDPRGL